MSWKEICNRADQFSKKWQGRLRQEGQDFLEIANTQTFYEEFFEVFGKDRSSVANYEERIHPKEGGGKHPKRADLLWPGVLLIEQKRPDKNLLDKAYKEAIDYVKDLPDSERPRYIMISDFNIFELYNGDVRDREEGLIKRFSLPDLPKHVETTFDFMLNFNMAPGLQSKFICDKDGTPMPGPIIRRIRKNARWLLLISWTIGLACGLVWSDTINSRRPAMNPSLGTQPTSAEPLTP